MLVNFIRKKLHNKSRRLRFCNTLNVILFLPLMLLSLSSIVVAQALKLNVTFDEIPAGKSGITWVHNNAHSSDRYLPETLGAGCAFLDYDNDGWMDVYLVNSGPADFYTPSAALKNALYHNNQDGTFTEVTDKTGVAGGTFGMGVAAADYDGDGWVDFYVTSYGRNLLYHNNGNGTFTDVADKAGVAAPGWSTCAVWFDYDNDGKLDLFVSSFVAYEKSLNILCTDETLSRRYYCVPRLFKPRPSHLFHNEGNGKFTDVSKESGIADSPGKSFGAVATDVNNDGLMDLFIANDTLPNFLFINKGGGKFEESGLAAGVAFSDAGKPRSGMGVDAADYDGDGWQDLFVANIDQEFFSLYHNQKDLIFADEPGEIGAATRMLSGWGLRFFDYDNDGDPDLFLVNGHPDDFIEMRTSTRVKYKEPLLMFENSGRAFKNVSGQSGAVFSREFSGRGMATGDLDNDGDLDVLVSNNGEAPLLLRNDGGNKNNWVGLQLVATKSNPAGVGVTINWQAGGVKRSRLRTAGGSYLSSHDPRELLGLGNARRIENLEVRWPSGKVDKLQNLPINSYVKVIEGEGVARK
ncbi:MAG TPA: CRTAC1 family protein [Pyrinomonadaceae bacterium]|nr:CRTAC1 family protein [Pyrinomonadaceae bacterium]